MTFPTPGPSHREATASLTFAGFDGSKWIVTAYPWGHVVGHVERAGHAGWLALRKNGSRVGMYPDKRAAAAELVKDAGYSLGAAPERP